MPAENAPAAGGPPAVPAASLDKPAVRASHADREAVVQRLQEASGEGRLTLAEFDERAALSSAGSNARAGGTRRPGCR